MEGGLFPRERELLRREEVDEKIPYPLLNPLQTAFEVFYEGWECGGFGTYLCGQEFACIFVYEAARGQGGVLCTYEGFGE
jgi:hypothetical protein